MLGLIAYAIYRLNAVGVNLAGIVTTSAIVTGALAFSAGETLRNLWAGVSLQLENTLRLGDWVRIDDKVGQVVSIRWRSMAIATTANETFVVPNSALMKDRVVVLGRAGEAPALYRRRRVTFQADYEHAPAKVIQVITEALRALARSRTSPATPAPFCVCKEFQDSGILYTAIYFPVDIGLTHDTRLRCPGDDLRGVAAREHADPVPAAGRRAQAATPAPRKRTPSGRRAPPSSTSSSCSAC